jgi:hypothetical protein
MLKDTIFIDGSPGKKQTAMLADLSADGQPIASYQDPKWLLRCGKRLKI